MKNRWSPRTCLKTAALIGMALLLPLAASAQQSGSDTHPPADADHLQNQTAMATQQPDTDTMAAIQAEMHAGQAVQEATRNGDDQARERARVHHRAAEMHAEALMARTCGATSEQIAEMRNQGMGWGQIARNMSVHPDALGLGHDGGRLPPNQAEMRQATTRHMETSRSATHGDRTSAPGMSGADGTMVQQQEQSHSRNRARSHMSQSGGGSRAGHSSRTGNSASHGSGRHR
jgi:hypothetical protein